ncbi:glycosyltransferase family 4 protein [Candidatus Parcubacteria bacterium]|nr:glycosyltransferase family 4 protein [Candidatus Parcubacteria bacterium]
MKVLIGITKSNFGGAQRYVFELAKAAKEARHDVAVLCGGEGPLVEKLEAEGIRVIPLPILERNVVLRRDYKNFFSIYHILRKERPDVFHLNSSKMGGLGSVAGRLTRVPKIIFTGHSFEFNAPRPEYQKIIFRFLTWLIIMFSHKTICVSASGRNALSRWPLVSKKLFLIRNGLESFTLLQREEARQKLVPGIKPSTLLVGTLAELHKVKGLDVLLTAFASAFKDSDTKCVIVGEGEERESLTNLSKALGIDSQVHFAGFVENAKALLSGLDIFVLSSRSEGMPYALLEAGLAGMPVVATHVGGIPEIVTDSETGLLVPTENPYFLSKALTELSKDQGKRERFGKNLKRFVEFHFSQSEMLEQTLTLYDLSQPSDLASTSASLPVSPEQATR